MLFALLTLGAVGHVILWVALVNRLHAVGISRWLIDLLTGLCGVALAVLPLAVAGAVLRDSTAIGAMLPTVSWAAGWSYVALCAAVCIISLIQRWCLFWHPERHNALLANHTSHVDVRNLVAGDLAAPGIPALLSRLPSNQALTVSLHEKQLAIPRLPRTMDGLRIAHLSDLHMSGRITKAYFEQVVEQVNGLRPDLVAITGDIVERSRCLDWIPDTLGRLRAPGGVYYVRGNHDRHVERARLHAALIGAGLIYLGGCWRHVLVRDVPLVLAGNELPWFPPAADLSDCPPHDAAGLPLRILLSHSPDQFGWAQANDVDLMLAGHNHGGQVRFPLLGPILAPSLHGVRYASGAFRAGETVLHVSRGTSCLTPLRYNCPPEIALLVLCHSLILG